MRRAIVAMGLLCSLLSASTALADYSVAANTCVPDATTINTINYVQTTSVFHDTGESGTRIQLRCMVPRNVGTVTSMSVTMANVDGNATYQVKVHFKRIAKLTGAETVVNSATLDSDDYSPSTAAVVERNLNITDHALDYGSYYYFIEIEVYRSGTTYTPKVYGVTLEE